MGLHHMWTADTFQPHSGETLRTLVKDNSPRNQNFKAAIQAIHFTWRTVWGLGTYMNAWEVAGCLAERGSTRMCVCAFPVAPVTEHHKLGSLKPQTFTLSQLWRPEVWNHCHWIDRNMLEAWKENPFVSSFSFWWLLALLGLWPHHWSLVSILTHSAPLFLSNSSATFL